MKIKFIFFIIPILVFYTDWFQKEWTAGRSAGWCIFIRPKSKKDIGLLEHELIHCKQFYRTFFLHVLLYKFNKSYRYNCEIEAYKKQLEYAPPSRKKYYVDKFAVLIALNYKLNVLVSDTVRDLQK